MTPSSDSPLDRLWKEYGEVFGEVDDLSLARWLSQTLSQIAGKSWRLSHPLIGAYRLGAQEAHDRQLWLKRLGNPPSDYTEAPCCRAPLVPLFTRDLLESGLICIHCNETGVPFTDLPAEMKEHFRVWAENYAPVHAVAHWDDRQRRATRDYGQALDDAAREAAQLLSAAALQLVPNLLKEFPVILWEDQDECLEVRPEDIRG